ncbi:MAG: lysophospholipid acyltransferase family protein [Fusobacteria bacterium]|nr:lysophospholipid acyltransferase family protein [Fusobacteriota bacterium]
MFRKYLVNIAVVAHLTVDTLLLFPFIWFFIKIGKRSLGERFACIIAKSWGRWFVRPTGAKIEVIYKDPTIKERFKDRAFVFISNHQSNMDIPVILGYFFKPVGFVAKLELANIKFFNMWMKLIGCVFLDRESPREAVKMLKAAVEKVESGKSIAIFPQGTRSDVITEFKKGSMKIALTTNAAIIPVTMIGTQNIFTPKPKKKVNAGVHVKMIVHSEIETENMSKAERSMLHITLQKIIEDEFYKNIN